MSPAARRPAAPVRRPGVRPPPAAPRAPHPTSDEPAARFPRDPGAAARTVSLPPTGPAAPQSSAAPPAAPPVTGGAGPAPEAADPAARRRRVWRVVGVLVAVLLLLAGAAYALLVSSLTALTGVQVSGADRTGPAAVEQAAADQLGLPLLRVDDTAVTQRVEQLPWVASARVERRFPHGLAVLVTEKVPVAAVPADGGAPGVVLLDHDGATITTADAAPEGVPLVQVDVAASGAAAVRAASAVALALPQDLRAQVASVTATGPDDVRLALRSGQEVRWGAPGDDDLKARVVALLLPREGVTRVDVSAPLAPATA
ncbi:FtsQ-type POTRA domain-containing protein [Quadrisphaera sp. INWT6]|uniref:cell division protein FtsQ/DivIB n=1 Tax=Quadrisphaera sp. INWT6 TaxID=2596917 RepID=UPI0018927FC8|nr:FtsQ-type POTRA domain-containing protein [Quadrisphaera sp. INWT6]MBF5080838.1 FtsQ-type POTRA domain-containing protein [Quadrisphaera sp. INWT6]